MLRSNPELIIWKQSLRSFRRLYSDYFKFFVSLSPSVLSLTSSNCFCVSRKKPTHSYCSGRRSASAERRVRSKRWHGGHEEREGGGREGGQDLHPVLGRRSAGERWEGRGQGRGQGRGLWLLKKCKIDHNRSWLSFLLSMVVGMVLKDRFSIFFTCVVSHLFQLRSSVYRQQLLVALLMHLSQQLSGINAVRTF